MPIGGAGCPGKPAGHRRGGTRAAVPAPGQNYGILSAGNCLVDISPTALDMIDSVEATLNHVLTVPIREPAERATCPPAAQRWGLGGFDTRPTLACRGVPCHPTQPVISDIGVFSPLPRPLSRAGLLPMSIDQIASAPALAQQGRPHLGIAAGAGRPTASQAAGNLYQRYHVGLKPNKPPSDRNAHKIVTIPCPWSSAPPFGGLNRDHPKGVLFCFPSCLLRFCSQP